MSIFNVQFPKLVVISGKLWYVSSDSNSGIFIERQHTMSFGGVTE